MKISYIWTAEKDIKTWLIPTVKQFYCEIKAWKKSWGMNVIWTNHFCDAGAVLYQLSYQAI